MFAKISCRRKKREENSMWRPAGGEGRCASARTSSSARTGQAAESRNHASQGQRAHAKKAFDHRAAPSQGQITSGRREGKDPPVDRPKAHIASKQEMHDVHEIAKSSTLLTSRRSLSEWSMSTLPGRRYEPSGLTPLVLSREMPKGCLPLPQRVLTHSNIIRSTRGRERLDEEGTVSRLQE